MKNLDFLWPSNFRDYVYCKSLKNLKPPTKIIKPPNHVWKCIKTITPKNIKANDKANVIASSTALNIFWPSLFIDCLIFKVENYNFTTRPVMQIFISRLILYSIKRIFKGVLGRAAVSCLNHLNFLSLILSSVIKIFLLAR